MAVSIGRIVVGGFAAGIAYLAAQSIDLKLTKNRTDDRILLGRLVPVPPSSTIATGTLMHLGNSLIVSAVYHLWIARRLKGPGWWKGVVFAMAENTLLYPLALLERFHPAVRNGEVDSYLSWTAYAQETWRHIAFGAVLGAIPAGTGSVDTGRIAHP
jgi:hypothetical protein